MAFRFVHPTPEDQFTAHTDGPLATGLEPGSTGADHQQCGLCGSTSGENFLEIDDYRLIQCLGCGLIYTSPLPPNLEVETMSTNLYDSDEYKNMYFQARERLSIRFKKTLNKIEQYKKKGRLLDVGCSYGFFLEMARDRWEVLGVETSQKCSRYAQDQLGIDVFTGHLSQANFPDQHFDVITMWDVLEHIPSPKSTLDEAARVLKDQGLLFIQCPNIHSLMARLTKYRHWAWLCVPDHLFQFSPGSLKMLLGRSDFKVLSIRTWEPLDEFLDNLLTGINLNPFRPGSRPAHVCYLFTASIIKAFQIVLSPLIWPLQRIWWSLGKGALIQVYAQKK